MIRLLEVSKRFGAVSALDRVTLQIDRGEFILITGPSGAGKTTLLRLLMAAEQPDQGEITIAGRNITRLCASSIPYLRRALGVIFQDFKLLADRSALDNVALALEIRGLSRREVDHRSREALEEVGLDERAHHLTRTLSGGEQQRVAIARAVVGRPPILLADEPTGNLDPERSHDILDLLERVSQAGTTVVAATHDPLVLQHAPCSRALLLEQGRLAGSRQGACAPLRPLAEPSPAPAHPLPALVGAAS